MKNAILIFALCIVSFAADAQLAGTKWKGKINIPNPTEVIFDFKDGVADVVTTTGMPVESCSYTIKSDTITFKKTKGGSPCPVGSMFTVTYTVKDNQMNINTLTDDCEGRKGTFTKEALVKVKD
ncbi:MAG: hypothetical protein EOP42_23925 [Sphingobacteriaceae bacterium]|nr:MAG: hypothetical protein EOP42_23925 [Sphingobacteriaceae bacterium]